MRILRSISIVIGISAASLSTVVASTPPPPPPLIGNVHVTLRGKHYDLSDVTTVRDVQTQLQAVSGVDTAQQGRVLFGGKRLEETDILSDVGVTDGSQLSIVPSSSSSSKIKKSSSATAAVTIDQDGSSSSSSTAARGSTTNAMMEDYLKNAGVDMKQWEQLVQEMGGQEAMQESMEKMNEMMSNPHQSIDMMKDLMNSPIFRDYMSDPEKLEESRQMILNTPMLKSMMAGMPGMEDLLNDPNAWREGMQAAANLFQNIDSETLVQTMNSLSGSGTGSGPTPQNPMSMNDRSSSTAALALDELDEED